jgi:splicing factor 1
MIISHCQYTLKVIPYERYPDAQFMGVILGPGGCNHKKLQELTGCKIIIRGKNIADKFQTEEESTMPQHVHIEADTEEAINLAEKIITPLLNPHSEDFERARVAGMEQLAKRAGVQGTTALVKAEQVCSVCGAKGHLGFECPDNQT